MHLDRSTTGWSNSSNMPFMSQALNVGPPDRDRSRHAEFRAFLAQRGSRRTGTHQGRRTHPSQPLPPDKDQVFTKLLNNSQRLYGDPEKPKLACLYDRMLIAGRGTPVDKELLQAPTCCRYHWQQHQVGKRQLIGAVLPYEDPVQPPSPASHVLPDQRKSASKLTTRVWRELRNNVRVQATLATVTVRWHNLRHDEGYNVASLHATLSPYGSIARILLTSPVSARITFTELQAACSVVEARSIGRASNPLAFLWYHRCMRNKGFYVRRKHLHVAYDQFVT